MSHFYHTGPPKLFSYDELFRLTRTNDGHQAQCAVKSSQVEGGREGLKEVWTFSQVSPFCLLKVSLITSHYGKKSLFFR